MAEYWDVQICDGCGKERQCHHDGSGGWYCPLCAGPKPDDTRRKAAAWDTLVTLLPHLGEWRRGAVLAADGRLLEWVEREAQTLR